VAVLPARSRLDTRKRLATRQLGCGVQRLALLLKQNIIVQNDAVQTGGLAKSHEMREKKSDPPIFV
jgi:hypothetical protein